MDYEGWQCLVCGRPPTVWLDGKPYCDKHKAKTKVARKKKFRGKSEFWEKGGYER